MDLIKMLGTIVDRMTFARDVSWGYDTDSSVWIELDATSTTKRFAENCLEVWDEVENEDYEYVLMTFDSESKDLTKISYGEEQHSVRELVSRYVKEHKISKCYHALCENIFDLLKEQN